MKCTGPKFNLTLVSNLKPNNATILLVLQLNLALPTIIITNVIGLI